MSKCWTFCMRKSSHTVHYENVAMKTKRFVGTMYCWQYWVGLYLKKCMPPSDLEFLPKKTNPKPKHQTLGSLWLQYKGLDLLIECLYLCWACITLSSWSNKQRVKTLGKGRRGSWTGGRYTRSFQILVGTKDLESPVSPLLTRRA